MLQSIRRWLDKGRAAKDPVEYARSIGVRVGTGCRLLGMDSWTFGSEPYLVTLGDHVSITGGVRFITHDGGVWVLRDEEPNLDMFGPITVGNNVFIGLNVLVMPGVTIGNHCVIGAGAVVTHDVPSGSIAVGVPARVVGTTSAYRERSVQNGHFLRHLPADEKRHQLENLFHLSIQNQFSDSAGAAERRRDGF